MFTPPWGICSSRSAVLTRPPKLTRRCSSASRCTKRATITWRSASRSWDAIRTPSASFQKAFEINSQRVEMGIGIGVSLLHLRRFADAVTAFENCLKTHPDDPAALFGKAFALQGASRLEEAEAAYLEALARDPSQEEALVNLIAVSIGGGNDSALQEYCGMLLSIRPESRIALEALMAADLAAANYEAACSHGEQLTRIAADSFEVWFNYGVACHGSNRVDDAAAAFLKATRIRPKSLEAFSSLGQTLQGKGDFAGAKAAYESALKLSPDNPAVLWNLVLVAEQSGASADAEKYCAMLASKSPKSDAVAFRLGSLRFQRNDYTGSADALPRLPQDQTGLAGGAAQSGTGALEIRESRRSPPESGDDLGCSLFERRLAAPGGNRRRAGGLQLRPQLLPASGGSRRALARALLQYRSHSAESRPRRGSDEPVSGSAGREPRAGRGDPRAVAAFESYRPSR